MKTDDIVAVIEKMGIEDIRKLSHIVWGRKRELNKGERAKLAQKKQTRDVEKLERSEARRKAREEEERCTNARLKPGDAVRVSNKHFDKSFRGVLGVVKRVLDVDRYEVRFPTFGDLTRIVKDYDLDLESKN